MGCKHLWLTASLLFSGYHNNCHALPVQNEPAVVDKRGRPGFDLGEPLDGNGKGGTILGMYIFLQILGL